MKNNEITQEEYDDWVVDAESKLERFKFVSTVKIKKVKPLENDKEEDPPVVITI